MKSARDKSSSIINLRLSTRSIKEPDHSKDGEIKTFKGYVQKIDEYKKKNRVSVYQRRKEINSIWFNYES